MSKHWAKEEAHKNIVLDALIPIAEWAKKNSKAVIGISAGLMLAGFFMWFISFQNRKTDIQSWAQYGTIQKEFASNNDAEKLSANVAQLKKKFEGRTAVAYALMFEGDIYYQKGDYAKAAEIYKSVLKGKYKDMEPFAALNVIAVTEATGDYKAVVNESNNFIAKYPSHFLSPQVFVALAKAQDFSGDANAAKLTYEKLWALFPDSPLAKATKAAMQAVIQPKADARSANVSPSGADAKISK